MWAVDNLAGGTYMDRPIVCCPLVGFVLGDALTGLIIGGFMELAWMGMLSFAGVIDSEPRFGAIPVRRCFGLWISLVAWPRCCHSFWLFGRLYFKQI